MNTYYRQAGLEAKTWLGKAEATPAPRPDSNWTQEPLYRLADYLAASRDFHQRSDALLHLHHRLRNRPRNPLDGILELNPEV